MAFAPRPEGLVKRGVRASWEEGITSIKVLRQERDWEIGGAEAMPVELKVVIEEEMSTKCDCQGGQVQGHAEPYGLYQGCRA